MKEMLKYFPGFTKSTTFTPDELNVLEAWQFPQASSHYEKSHIFGYYLKWRPQFETPHNSVIFTDDKKYYTYCFGEFTPLIVIPRVGTNVIAYLELLIDVYDTCKGYARRIMGDTPGIKIIREAITKKNLLPLHQHDFKQYSYPFERIHAHTMAMYRLSTLLLRITSHFLYNLSSTSGEPIMVQQCSDAYDNNFYGKPIISNIGTNVGVKCHTCTLMTERQYGRFNVCLDCHTREICSVCGASAQKAQMINQDQDGLPKCEMHNI
jgi:hypothetical protein